MASSKEIRVVQLIDSLEAGGAERMAVNYANALHRNVGFGALVATRAEGNLKKELLAEVKYCCLNRKSTLDFKALLLLRHFVIRHQITHVHTHSSSLFFGVLLKFLLPRLQLIWHDHYGKSEMVAERKVFALRVASWFVSKIVAVNQQLVTWARANLYCKTVLFLPNFTSDNEVNSEPSTYLRGIAGKRIVCLANLRPQKNHFLLLHIAKELHYFHPEWTFHLVGKDFEDSYSRNVKKELEALDLTDVVYIYGSRSDVPFVLRQATIGILTSASEGLPMALLEYGLQGIAVVSTNVGEIPSVLSSKEGILLSSTDKEGFVLALKSLIEDVDLRSSLAAHLHQKIILNYSEKAVIALYLEGIHDT